MKESQLLHHRDSVDNLEGEALWRLGFLGESCYGIHDTGFAVG